MEDGEPVGAGCSDRRIGICLTLFLEISSNNYDLSNSRLAQEFLDDGGDGAAVGELEEKDFAFDGAYGLHGGLDVFLDLLFECHIAFLFVSEFKFTNK